MKRPDRRLISAAGAALAAFALTAAAEGPGTTLEVEVNGLSSDDGSVGLALFDSETSYDEGDRPLRAAFVPIKGRQARWVVPSLPAGSYAVKAFHDSNGNGELDLSSLRMPTEAYGFSNGAKGRFGPPAFDDARFQVGGQPTVIEIRVD